MESRIITNDVLGEQYTEIIHDSGLRIFIAKKEMPTYHAIFGTRYGSVDNIFSVDGEEIEVPEGIAHFLEHKMFENESGGDAFELYAETGADANAYTSFDQTAYIFSCSDRFYDSLEILLNMVTHPHFTEESVKKEMGIIGEEIKMCEDRPGDTLFYGSLKALYEKSPVRISIAGTVESISKITPELLYKCYNSFYRMNNMTLSVCGDVDVEKVLDVVNKAIPYKLEEKPIHRKTEESPKVSCEMLEFERDISKPMFRIGIKYPEGNNDSLPAAEVLAGAMFEETEDFFSDIFESELVGQYYFGYEFSRAYSHFCIGGDSNAPDEVYKRFKSYCKKIRENGVPQDAIERAKRVLYANIVKLYDNPESIAEEMYSGFLNGIESIDMVDRFVAVTKEQVDEIARLVLDEERFCICTVVPKK